MNNNMSISLNMSPHGCAGRLIAFAGLKGTGKTTLIHSLIEFLQERGIEALHYKQHTSDFYQTSLFQKYAADVDTISRGEIDIGGFTFLSLGDTLQMARSVFLPLLRDGKWILVDRYVVDQVAGYAEFSNHLAEFELVKQVANLLPRPDMSFYIDIDSQVSIQRILQRDGIQSGIHYDQSFYSATNQLFLAFAQQNHWIILNGNAPADILVKQTISHLQCLL